MSEKKSKQLRKDQKVLLDKILSTLASSKCVDEGDDSFWVIRNATKLCLDLKTILN